MPGYFVGVGASKCGTSWIGQYLRKHPDVFFPAKKELHVFDALFGPGHERSRARRDRDTARQIRQSLDGAKPHDKYQILDRAMRWAMIEDLSLYPLYFEYRRQGKPSFGEITPEYGRIGAEGMQAIRGLYPGAKVFFIMRDPVARLWSYIRHQCELELERSGKVEKPEMRLSTLLAQSPERIKISDYTTTLESMGTVFPPEQQLVLFYEELFGPAANDHLNSLTEFLGISFVDPNLDRVVNRSPPATLPPELEGRAAKQLADIYRYVFDRFGDAVPLQWRQTAERHGL